MCEACSLPIAEIINATQYHSLLGILKFENVYKFKAALFTHKILNDSTNHPTIFHRNIKTRASEIHTHNTRFSFTSTFHKAKADNYMLWFHLNYGKLFQQTKGNCLTLPSTTKKTIPFNTQSYSSAYCLHIYSAYSLYVSHHFIRLLFIYIYNFYLHTFLISSVIDISFVCVNVRVFCLYVSVTNTKAYATLVTEQILFWLCIVIFLFSFLIDVISVIHLSNSNYIIIFVNSG